MAEPSTTTVAPLLQHRVCRAAALVIMVVLLLVSTSTTTSEDWYNETRRKVAELILESEKEDDSSTTLSSPSLTLLPLTTTDAIAFGLASIGLLIAAGGGIGGGGILVPIYILVLGFGPDHAIPLSNVTIFGGSLANIWLNANKRHPEADRPLIDWDLILILEPMTISGALIGAHLNVFLPDVAVILFLVVLLMFTGVKTCRKAIKMHDKETQGWNRVDSDDEDGDSDVELTTSSEMMRTPLTNGSHSVAANQAHPEEAASARPAKIKKACSDPKILSNISEENCNGDMAYPSRAPLARTFSSRTIATRRRTLQNIDEDSTAGCDENGSHSVRDDVPSTRSIVSSTMSVVDSESGLHALEHILEEERTPKREKISIISTMFLFVLVVNVLKGGSGLRSPLGIECASLGFWLIEGLIVLITLCVCLYARAYLLSNSRRKDRVGYAYLDSDVRWDERSTIINPILCTGAGMVAGLCGVGGGLIKAPLMLALGVNPAVASATSATMILFTTFTAATSFLAFGVLTLDYAGAGLVLGFFATLLGQTLMNALIAKSGRDSYIAFSIAGVVVISAFLLSAEWVLSFLEHGSDYHTKSFCGARHH